MEPTLRPEFTVDEIENETVVAAETILIRDARAERA
jgi:hypothetical protein